MTKFSYKFVLVFKYDYDVLKGSGWTNGKERYKEKREFSKFSFYVSMNY
jgi:hypothetical protein